MCFSSHPQRVKKLRFFTEIQALDFLSRSFLYRKPGVGQTCSFYVEFSERLKGSVSLPVLYVHRYLTVLYVHRVFRKVKRKRVSASA